MGVRPTLDARATLITEVLDALRTRANKDETLWDTTKEKFTGLASRIKWPKAITLASRSAVTFTLPSVESLVEIFGDKPEVADPTLQGFARSSQSSWRISRTSAASSFWSMTLTAVFLSPS